ncbi:ATP-binding protein, partial [Pseudoalteromonas lipolytica]
MLTLPLYTDFRKELEPLITKGHKAYTVALSGGVDSVVLLHLMAELHRENTALSVDAVYVNHGLSEYAGQWQSFCETLCSSLAVPFKAIKVNIETQARTSLEAQARDARY